MYMLHYDATSEGMAPVLYYNDAAEHLDRGKDRPPNHSDIAT